MAIHFRYSDGPRPVSKSSFPTTTLTKAKGLNPSYRPAIFESVRRFHLQRGAVAGGPRTESLGVRTATHHATRIHRHLRNDHRPRRNRPRLRPPPSPTHPANQPPRESRPPPRIRRHLPRPPRRRHRTAPRRRPLRLRPHPQRGRPLLPDRRHPVLADRPHAPRSRRTARRRPHRHPRNLQRRHRLEPRCRPPPSRLPTIQPPHARDARPVTRERPRRSHDARRIPAIPELDRRLASRQCGLRSPATQSRPAVHGRPGAVHPRHRTTDFPFSSRPAWPTSSSRPFTPSSTATVAWDDC